MTPKATWDERNADFGPTPTHRESTHSYGRTDGGERTPESDSAIEEPVDEFIVALLICDIANTVIIHSTSAPSFEALEIELRTVGRLEGLATFEVVVEQLLILLAISVIDVQLVAQLSPSTEAN